MKRGLIYCYGHLFRRLPSASWLSLIGELSFCLITTRWTDIVQGEVPNLNINVSVSTVRARYEVDSDTWNIIDGNVRIALWDTGMRDFKNHLFYDDNGEYIRSIAGAICSRNKSPVDLYVDGESEHWGAIVDRKRGPERVNGDLNYERSEIRQWGRGCSLHRPRKQHLPKCSVFRLEGPKCCRQVGHVAPCNLRLVVSTSRGGSSNMTLLL